jgi:hypothetical protein
MGAAMRQIAQSAWPERGADLGSAEHGEHAPAAGELEALPP